MAAHLEHLGRSQDLLKGVPAKERDDLFRGIHAQSPVLEKPGGMTLAELIRAKELSNTDLKRSIKTVSAFLPNPMPGRLQHSRCLRPARSHQEVPSRPEQSLGGG